MTFRLGLTGSIGMGKSTTARMFAERGYPVWDADAAVHRLYTSCGAAMSQVSAAFPGVIRDGVVDRALLKEALAEDDAALEKLEAIVHPLVARDRAEFISQAAQGGAALVVLDIPLLFETGAEAGMDGVAVVSTDAATQRKRVLARPGMTEETLSMILSRQLPDDEKRARADWVIPTDDLSSAHAAVDEICREIEERKDA
ncbi:dephospho-CoA kinase [Paracoccus sediminicola]|uniref:dephospho-CoA kinase n=1 Tax=Paracoccus sediminicola TaxID=3017783 RepID=UPI0022F140F6|nr:dephospho-CoA kinase [Paracoccus sediminicola]WBU56360.1 dephospho-CoA kinase [Paracoccus sediminicola]